MAHKITDPPAIYGKPACYACKHFNPNWICAAFPDGIPLLIAANIVLHDQPLTSGKAAERLDNGIQFELKPDLSEKESITYRKSHPIEAEVNPPKCLKCNHFKKTDPPSCNAYPSGIPKIIYWNYISHTTPFPDDNGIQFKYI